MNHAYSNLLFAGTEHVPMLCFLILSKEMTKGDSENLEKSKKNENLKPYEISGFIKGLESQSKDSKSNYDTQGEVSLPTLGFRCKSTNKF